MQTVMKKHLEWLKCRVAISKEFEDLLLEQEKEQMRECWNTLMTATALNKPIFFEDYFNLLKK
jgi:hypothetical protein